MLSMPIYENLALEGGGTKGHIYMGAALELEKIGVLAELKSISGASVGAIAALLFATGWPVSKIQERYNKMDFETMAMGGILDKLWLPYNLKMHYGAFDGKAFHNWFKEIINEVTGDPNTTFKQWHDLKKQKPELKDLFIDACNLETELNETFSHLSEHAEVSIADAIFASMKFPGFFTPFKIKNTLYIDGGTQRNCPSGVFETKSGQFNPKTLSIRLDHQNEINYYEKGIKPPKKRPKNMLQALGAILGAATKSQDYNFFDSPYKEHTIFATTFDVGTLDFDLSEQQKKDLLESGQYSVTRYFEHHHPELTKGKYAPEYLTQIRKLNFPLTITDFKNAAIPVGKTRKSVAHKAVAVGGSCNAQTITPLRSLKESIEQTATLEQKPRRSARLSH